MCCAEATSTWRILKLKPTTIYLCLPAMRMGTHARWLRLMIFLALTVMERTPEKPKEPVLFVLDEFPVLGHMQPIETAAGLMAGYGVKLWTIVQNLGQLKQHYDKSWETFFANAGVVTGFGVIDQESQRALSAKLGKLRMTTQVPTGAAGSELLKGTPSQRDERFNVPLLAEDELGQHLRPRDKAHAHPWSGPFASDCRAARIFRGTNVRQALRRAEAAAITIKALTQTNAHGIGLRLPGRILERRETVIPWRSGSIRLQWMSRSCRS